MGILFWNSEVPSLDGIVRRAATFHVRIVRVLGAAEEEGAGDIGIDFLRRGGEMGMWVDIRGVDGWR